MTMLKDGIMISYYIIIDSSDSDSVAVDDDDVDDGDGDDGDDGDDDDDDDDRLALISFHEYKNCNYVKLKIIIGKLT